MKGIKTTLVPIGNFIGNVVAMLGSGEAIGTKVILLPTENDKSNLVVLKPVPIHVGSKVVIFPIRGDKNNLVIYANSQLLFISGNVYDWDLQPVEDERIDLITSQTRIAYSDEVGYYIFWALKGHDYVVQAHEPCFSPAQYSFPNLQSSQENKSFYEIAVLGHVYHSDLTPYPSISIHIPSAGNTDSSDEEGFYVLKRINRGNCIVEPVISGQFLPEKYEFNPISERQLDKDFIERCGYTVKGYVFESDGVTPITDYQVFVTGDKEDSVLTDVDGLYTLPNHVPFYDLCIDGNYEVYPYKSWYFYPEKYTYEPLGGFKINQNFVKGTTFYQVTRHNAFNFAYGNYWPGGGSFPIPGEDHVQKVRFGATITVSEDSLNPILSFKGKTFSGETLWSTGNIAAGETKHEEVFYLDYTPSMTPDGFYVLYTIGNQWHHEIAIWDFHGEIEFLYEESNPSIETFDATNVTDTTATLNGKLNEIGWEECTVWFEWGADKDNYDNETTHESFSLKWNFSAGITGLTPNLGYWFRAIVLSGENTYYGTDKYFMNPPYPPEPEP